MGELEEHRRFEADVRRTAEAVWSLEPGECQPQHYTDDPVITELDGLVRLRDATHLFMVTVSRKITKVQADVKKLRAAEKKERDRSVPVQKWLITRDQLEAEHIEHCRTNSVTTLTLEQFTSRFFDGRSYVSKRRNAPFGSARDPESNGTSIPEDEYVRLPIRIFANESGRLPQTQETTVSGIVDLLEKGTIVVVMAPFGGGKSLTAREVFLQMAKQYLKDTTKIAPIAVDLRDHWGQKYGDEILERHAREIGFTPIHDVVIAWRARLASLILDGFDEVAAQTVGRLKDRNFMRDARAEALAGVQHLVSKRPSGAGILITGRDHYFDSHSELRHALGLTTQSFVVAELAEFGETETKEYLRRKKFNVAIPDWLPRKPLLLGYLASRNLLDQALQIDDSNGIGFVWTEFLRRICEREATYGRLSMDSNTVRRILERLAFDVRTTSSGVGPITERDLADAYLAETGDNPGEAVLMQLQRLPGLTARGQDIGTRTFIDEALLSALQGSGLARYILENKESWSRNGIQAALAPDAAAMAAYAISSAGGTLQVVLATIARLDRNDLRSRIDPQIAADCAATALELARDIESIDFHNVRIESAYFGRVSLEGRRVDGLRLVDCIVDTILIDEIGATSNVIFERCDIARVGGASSLEALPAKMFLNCTIGRFDEMNTNSAIVRSNLPPAMKALLDLTHFGGRVANSFSIPAVG